MSNTTKEMLLLAVLAGACGREQTSEPSDGGDIGLLNLALAQVPADVQCLRVIVTGTTRTAVKDTDLVPGMPAVINLSRLPTGNVTVDIEAFGVSCAQVTEETVPMFLGGPTQVVLQPGQPVNLNVELVRNGTLTLSVGFEPSPTTTPVPQPEPEPDPEPQPEPEPVPELSCEPDAHRCEGAALVHCRSDGLGEEVREICSAAHLCDAVAPRCRTCDPGQVRCRKQTSAIPLPGASEHEVVEVCSDDGTSWELKQSCKGAAPFISAEYCSVTQAACLACRPGATRCGISSSTVERCADDGSGWIRSHSCSGGFGLPGRCAAGACQ